MVFVCLSTGCLEDIFGGRDYDKPIIQVLGTKSILNGNEHVRYRLVVSDGKHSISLAMLATQLNKVVDEKELTDNAIIRVEKYITSIMSPGKKVLIILDLTVLHHGAEVKEKIGEPIHMSDLDIPKKSAASTQQFLINQNQPTNSNVIPTSNIPSSSRVTTSSSLPNDITPIASLTPYSNQWVIRARVTSKSNMRMWKSSKGDGHLFSMDLKDESGEIRATCFNEQALRNFEFIETDKVYDISKGRLKAANKQYSSLQNDFEMSFGWDTTVKEYDGAIDTIPKVTYNVVALEEIAHMKANAIVDVSGICQHAGDVVQITAKATGRELKKREVTLVDNSVASVTLTLWGSEAESFDGKSNDVIFIKGGKINEFGGGKSITLVSGSCMRINPDISEAHRLRGWYNNVSHDQTFSSVSARTVATNATSEWLSFYEAREKALGSSEKPDYFQCIATVHLIKTNSCTYKSCPKSDCNKKVVDQDNGLFRCERCDRNTQDFQYKIILNASLADWTTNRWVTIFSDEAEKLLEASSAEVGRAFDNNKDELNDILAKVLFKSYNFKLRTRMEKYGDAERNKIQVMNIGAIDYREYNKYLIKNIQALTGIGKNENPNFM